MIISVVTEVGELHGRDAIFLDEHYFDAANQNLTLRGSVNSNLCTNAAPGSFIPYEIIFKGVTDFDEIELDTWIELGKPEHSSSSFFCVSESESEKKFVFQTYDIVFEMFATSYEMQFEYGT